MSGSNHYATFRRFVTNGGLVDAKDPYVYKPLKSAYESVKGIKQLLPIDALENMRTRLKINIEKHAKYPDNVKEVLNDDYKSEEEFDMKLFRALKADLDLMGVIHSVDGVRKSTKHGDSPNRLIFECLTVNNERYAFGIACQESVLINGPHISEEVSPSINNSDGSRSNCDHACCIFKEVKGVWKIEKMFSIVELKLSDTTSECDKILLKKERSRKPDPIIQPICYVIEHVWKDICKSGLAICEMKSIPIVLIAAKKSDHNISAKRKRVVKGSLLLPSKWGDAIRVQSNFIEPFVDKPVMDNFDESLKGADVGHSSEEDSSIDTNDESLEGTNDGHTSGDGDINNANGSDEDDEMEVEDCRDKCVGMETDEANSKGNDKAKQIAKEEHAATNLYMETILEGVELLTMYFQKMKDNKNEGKIQFPSPVSGLPPKALLEPGYDFCGSPLLSKDELKPFEEAEKPKYYISQGDLHYFKTLNLSEMFKFFEDTRLVKDDKVDDVFVKVWSPIVHNTLHTTDNYESAYKTIRLVPGLKGSLSEVLIGAVRSFTSMLTITRRIDGKVVEPSKLEEEAGEDIEKYKSELKKYWSLFENLCKEILLPLAKIGIIHQDLRVGHDCTYNIMIGKTNEKGSEVKMRLIDYESLCLASVYKTPQHDTRYPIQMLEEEGRQIALAGDIVFQQCVGVAYAWTKGVKAEKMDFSRALKWFWRRLTSDEKGQAQNAIQWWISESKKSETPFDNLLPIVEEIFDGKRKDKRTRKRKQVMMPTERHQELPK